MSNAIDIQDLVVEFPGARGDTVRALQGLSLSVAQGQVYGFLGPNGAGKTTTMHVLLGFIEATAGVARLFDEPTDVGIATRLYEPALESATVVLPPEPRRDWALWVTAIGLAVAGALILVPS